MLWYFFAASASLGGLLFLGQIILGFVVDHDGPDADLSQAHSDLTPFLSIRALSAAVTIMGLAGLAARASDWSDPVSLLVALVSGGVAMLLGGLLINSMRGLNADGTAKIAEAVGQIGRVYLTVPPERSGAGKVTVTVGGRSLEYPAVTRGGALATHTLVRVTGVIGGDTLEVELEKPGE